MFYLKYILLARPLRSKQKQPRALRRQLLSLEHLRLRQPKGLEAEHHFSALQQLPKVLGGGNGVSAMYGLLKNQDPAKDEAYRAKLYKGLAAFAGMADATGNPAARDQFREIASIQRNFDTFVLCASNVWILSR